jgi:hypothetical protein
VRAELSVKMRHVVVLALAALITITRVGAASSPTCALGAARSSTAPAIIAAGLDLASFKSRECRVRRHSVCCG